MATYPGMSLGGEVRESISLDEDDLSDVEDEVFIRDGKNSYKLAEELNVKRPLMAPRRKLGKPDLTSRFKNKPPCKAFCRPCCYIFAALSVLIGLIALVVVLVSIFPLPLDKLKNWIMSKSTPITNRTKLLPCNNLKITDVWSTNLPVLTTDSPVRILDLDRDGVDDIIFGFGTGDNYHVLSEEIFCPVFLGVAPPCEGGVIALNGTTGEIAWRYWTNDTIFDLQCSADLNGDDLVDCLAVGTKGSLIAIDSRNGSLIWLQHQMQNDIYVANFVMDQNNDSVPDILSSHSSREDGKGGHLIFISGKTGEEISRINMPNDAKTYYMPQLLKLNDSQSWVVFGSGSPNSPGNLSIASIQNLLKGNMSARAIYEDHYSGILTQSVLVDITGDQIPDIVTAMYNSTLVAIDGMTFGQIWNYTIPNSVTNIVPTPAYFNDDNVTDFLIIYEKYDRFQNDSYTKTFIIDGKTGKSISSPIIGSVKTQMNGLSLRMEGYGFDMFVFWTTSCANVELYKKKNIAGNAVLNANNDISDVCRQQFNSTSIMKLQGLNRFDQPPGFEIYNSEKRSSLEFNNIKSAMKQVQEYITKHPKFQMTTSQGQSEIDENYGVDDSQQVRLHKYGSSSFRHKDNRQGIIKDYMSNENNPEVDDGMYTNNVDYNEMVNDLPGDIDAYPDDMDRADSFGPQNQMLYSAASSKNNRDPRSKGITSTKTQSEENTDAKKPSTKKKNLSDPKYGIYDYKNIKMARNRLLHDLTDLPSEILRDTYFKNRESQLRKSKFEQRDITSHIDKMKQNEEVKNIVSEERKAADNNSLNLWDLESEKETQEKEGGFWRGKRETNYIFNSIRKISSVGAIVQSSNQKTNSIDIVFITYWIPTIYGGAETFEQEIINDCIDDKRAKESEEQIHSYQKTTAKEQRALYMAECRNELQHIKSEFPYFNQIYQLRLGQMSIYRLNIECLCNVESTSEKCAKFLPQSEQSWPMYLGKLGNGHFQTNN